MLFSVTIAVESPGWFPSLVQASGITKRCNTMAGALATQFSLIEMGFVWARTIALLGERVYTKEHFSDKMPFPFPIPQNQIKIFESYPFT